MSTYLEMYVDALKQKIDDGGTEAEITTAVDEYNSFSEEAFQRWLATLSEARCISCGKAFAPPRMPASAEVLCEEHAPK